MGSEYENQFKKINLDLIFKSQNIREKESTSSSNMCFIGSFDIIN